jgi:hypothetical protein
LRRLEHRFANMAQNCRNCWKIMVKMILLTWIAWRLKVILQIRRSRITHIRNKDLIWEISLIVKIRRH